MIDIKGTTLVTTDWHFGLKSNSDNKLRILIEVTKKISTYLKENKVDNFLYCGDLFHSRSNLSINTINYAIKCVEAVARNCKNVYLIIGNHDIFNRSTVDINSVNIFKHIKNVTIIKDSTECTINGKKCLLVPWLGNIEYEKNTFDMIFGHFDINSKYLTKSYIEDHIQNTATIEEIRKLIESDELLQESGLEDMSFEIENNDETYLQRTKSSDLIGEWIEIVKEGGAIFAGHIHKHKEFPSKKRKFIFIGSPYQTTRTEINTESGFYILKQDNSYEFHELEGLPKFIDIKMSDILKDVDGFNYDIVKGNTIHKIYDVEVERILEAKINRKIDDRKPFDEIPPDYRVAYNQDGTVIESIEAIRKSKLDYLRLFIKTIDEAVLKDKNIDREKLISMMTDYYNQVAE